MIKTSLRLLNHCPGAADLISAAALDSRSRVPIECLWPRNRILLLFTSISSLFSSVCCFTSSPADSLCGSNPSRLMWEQRRLGVVVCPWPFLIKSLLPTHVGKLKFAVDPIASGMRAERLKLKTYAAMKATVDVYLACTLLAIWTWGGGDYLGPFRKILPPHS